MRTLTQKLFKKICILVLLLCLGMQVNAQQEISASLESGVSQLDVGQTIIVNLFLEPELGNSIYTVSANLVYEPSKLDLVSTVVDPKWFELTMGDVHLTDQVNGLIIRTAGYPNGFSTKTKFATYIFKAKRAGNTKITMTTGQAYNDVNNKITLKNSDLNILVNDVDNSVDTAKDKSKVFDVSLSIRGNNAFYRQEPYTFTLYHKKEEVAQQAITKIWLFDENWKVHFEDEKLWRTDMDNVLNFVIPADTLSIEGNFKLIAKVRYEDGIEYEVAEKELGVLSNGKTWFTKNSDIFMPFFFVLVLVSIIHHFFAEREIYFKIKKYMNQTKPKNRQHKRSL